MRGARVVVAVASGALLVAGVSAPPVAAHPSLVASGRAGAGAAVVASGVHARPVMAGAGARSVAVSASVPSGGGVKVGLSPATRGAQVAASVDPLPDGRGVPATSLERAYEKAAEQAVASGVKVLVDAATTATTRVWVTPQENLEADISAGPVRVRRDGRWVAADESLVASGEGWLRPAAGTMDVQVATSHTGPLLQVRPADGVSVLLGVPGRRRGRVHVSGSQAWWGSGQQIDVDRESVELAWGFHTPRRVRAGRTLAVLPAATAGGRWRRLAGVGGVELVDASGARVAVLSQVMATSTARSARTGDPVTIVPVRVVPVGEGAGTRLRLVAAADVPAGFTGNLRAGWSAAASDTWVEQGYDSGNSQQSSKELRAGTDAGKARSYLKFDTSALTGRRILAATLDMNQFWQVNANSCAMPIYVRRVTDPIDYATLNWSNQPASSLSGQQVIACGNGLSRTPGLESQVQVWADNPALNHGFKVMIDKDQESTPAAAATQRSTGRRTGSPETTWPSRTCMSPTTCRRCFTRGPGRYPRSRTGC